MKALEQAAWNRLKRMVPATIVIIVAAFALAACQALLMPSQGSGSGTITTATEPVNLSWTASAGPSVIGYRVFCGTSSGQYTLSVDVGNVTSYTLEGLSLNTKYYIVVVAYNSVGMSSYSNEVTCH